MAHRGAHAPHHPLAALLDHDGQRRRPAFGGLGHLGASGPGPAVVELDAFAQRTQRRGCRPAFDLDEVLLFHAVARVGEQLGEVAVVGQQQQPFGVEVEAADGEDARLLRNEVEHGGAIVGVVRGGHVARGLVEQPVHEVAVDDHRDPVERDPIGRRVDAPAEHRHLTIDRHPALGDEHLVGASRTEARTGEHLLQPLALALHRASARS